MTPLTPGRIGPIEALSPPGASRDALTRLLPAFEPGELLGASVQRRLGDGSFTVELSGQLMRMALPQGTRPGDRLTLAFAGDQPRLTFLLQATQAADASLPQLSAAGRQVATLMVQAMAGDAAQMEPVRVAAAAPLMAGAPAQPAPLAQALGRALAQSGLFYEAHQARWVGGSLTLAQLRQEPQARILAAATPQAAAFAGLDAPLAASVTASASAGANEGSLGTPHARQDAPIHPSSQPLVQQQLGALESGRFALALQIWPEQWMQWEIEEQAPGGGDEPSTEPEWRTRLRLDLPSLGAIDATLTLRADGVHVLVAAADGDSAALLAGQRTALRQALEDAGVPASVIAISALEPASDPSDPSSSSQPSSRRRPGSSPATAGFRPSPE